MIYVLASIPSSTVDVLKHTHPNMCLIVSLLMVSSLYLCKHSSSNKHDSHDVTVKLQKRKKKFTINTSTSQPFMPILCIVFQNYGLRFIERFGGIRTFWRYPNDNKAIAFKQGFNGGRFTIFMSTIWNRRY
jgi:hypothetical protein